ncbi:MAG: succinate dehydrogenase [Candidatus Desulforudis sp.]|nr:succinate dehydrogenase [Desulforudis sp.]
MEKPEAPRLNPRTDLYLELTALVSGIMLVAFVWLHAFLVATVIPGAPVFDGMARFLDRYSLGQIGITLLLLAGLTHILAAARRIPTGYREQRSLWRVAGRMRHTDSYAWAFQVVTGLFILVLAATHIWVVVADWPLEAVKSAWRVQTDYLGFYLVLLLISEFHGGVGLYRQSVKWLRFRRRPLALAVGAVVAFILAVNLAAIWALLRLGGVS